MCIKGRWTERNSCSYKIFRRKIYNPLYADDTTMIAENVAERESVSPNNNIKGTQWTMGLSLNTNKLQLVEQSPTE